MMIALHTPVHYRLVPLFADSFSCHLGVHPVRITPHARIDLAKLDGRARMISDGLSERGVEVSVVQKDVWVIKPSIEMPFHRLD